MSSRINTESWVKYNLVWSWFCRKENDTAIGTTKREDNAWHDSGSLLLQRLTFDCDAPPLEQGTKARLNLSYQFSKAEI